ncbi:MAG: peptide ABC transporter [Acidobacteria bacterium RIFCSPLOWO2_12_FULL_54_10]|nr:MAG: peptide ABC transporter [Acidobacteria bacterium RIFCSPLOWO2_12_FULL_54_10]
MRVILSNLAQFLGARLLYSVPVIFLVVSLVFFLIHMVPGDPVQQMLGEGARAADVEQLRHDLGLDRPLAEQYIAYWKGLARGDLGRSFRFNSPVAGTILARYPSTIKLSLAALLVALILAIPAGVQAAVYRGQWKDRLLGFLSLLGLSFPSFALGPVLILIFSIHLGWLPVSGSGSLLHLVLPSLTLGGALAAILTRMTRASMLEELQQDYVRTARAKGLSEQSVRYRHALRNGLLPVVTLVGLQLGALLTGAMVTEVIFSWPGIGRLTLQAINSRDYPLVQGCFLAIAITYIFVNLLTDLIYTLVDPRIREV